MSSFHRLKIRGDALLAYMKTVIDNGRGGNLEDLTREIQSIQKQYDNIWTYWDKAERKITDQDLLAECTQQVADITDKYVDLYSKLKQLKTQISDVQDTTTPSTRVSIKIPRS